MTNWRNGFLTAVMLLAFGTADAAITSETRGFAEDANALFLWAVDPSDMTFDEGASDFSALTGWSLDTNPYGAAVPNSSAWVLTAPAIATGGGVVTAGSATVSIGFDYVVGGLFGASVFQYQYALVLFDGTDATVQHSGARTLVRSALVNGGANVGPALTAAQFNAIDTYFATMPAAASVPIPNSVVLMASAIAFVGFKRKRNG